MVPSMNPPPIDSSEYIDIYLCVGSVVIRRFLEETESDSIRGTGCVGRWVGRWVARWVRGWMGRLVGGLVSWWVGRWVGWWAGEPVGRVLGQSVGHSVGWFVYIVYSITVLQDFADHFASWSVFFLLNPCRLDPFILHLFSFFFLLRLLFSFLHQA